MEQLRRLAIECNGTLMYVVQEMFNDAMKRGWKPKDMVSTQPPSLEKEG
jgi:hypothetical protein